MTWLRVLMSRLRGLFAKRRSEGLFTFVNAALLRGRVFTGKDGTVGHGTAIVNERLAAMYFKDEEPIGRRIRLTDESTRSATTPWLSIVGVSPTVRQRPFQEPGPVVYLPYRVEPAAFAALMVRCRSEQEAVASMLCEELRRLDPDLPLYAVMTMDQLMAETRWMHRVFGAMFAVFAIIALVLSAVGLYAVTAYSVIQRSHEIGVRMALGARPGQVWWLIGRRVSIQVTAGLVLGMCGAMGVGRLLQSMLVQTSATDLVTLVSIGLLLAAVSVTAWFLPARRATGLNPVVTLRHE